MKSPYHLVTLIALLVLTGITAVVFFSTSHSLTAILVLAMAKVLLVLFRFMDLRHAHMFWKFTVVLFSTACLVGVSLFASS